MAIAKDIHLIKALCFLSIKTQTHSTKASSHHHTTTPSALLHPNTTIHPLAPPTPNPETH